jgi:hypothetical protein
MRWRRVGDPCRWLNIRENTTGFQNGNSWTVHVIVKSLHAWKDARGWVSCLLRIARAHVHRDKWTEGLLNTLSLAQVEQ